MFCFKLNRKTDVKSIRFNEGWVSRTSSELGLIKQLLKLGHALFNSTHSMVFYLNGVFSV